MFLDKSIEETVKEIRAIVTEVPDDVSALGDEYARTGPDTLQRVQVDTERLKLRVGELTVESTNESGLVGPKSIRLLIDGKPIAARRLVITLDIHEAPLIELDFYPREG